MIADKLNAGMRLPKNVKWADFDVSLVSFVSLSDAAMATKQSLAGPCPVLVVNDEPIIVCGIVKISDCVGEAWSMINHDLAKQHPLLLTRAVRKAIDITTILHGLHRVQMVVHSQQNEAIRWAFALGFIVESLMIKYGDDQSDHFMFVRL